MSLKRYTPLLSLIFFLSACSVWKNQLVPYPIDESYAYQGDTLHDWSLVRLDSMGGPWGYISHDGKRAIAPVFDWADDFVNSLALVRYQGHYTYLNQQGKQMRRIKAPYAYPFSEGLAAVQKGDKWGYINDKGEWVIKPKFDWAMPFSENRAAIVLGNQHGFINPQGDIVIRPEYEDVKSFIHQLSIVKRNGQYGLIDTFGKEVLPTHFNRIERWKNGTYKLHVNNKRMGLADADGNMLLDTLYTSITVQADRFLRVVHDRLAGLFDFNGKEILSPEYYFLGFVSDEGFLAAIKNDKYGIVDTAGKTLLPFIYDDGQAGFREGRIAVYQGDKLLLMDRTFEVIRTLPYEKSYSFSNGFAIVEQRDDTPTYGQKLGYINHQGEEVISPIYSSAYGFGRHGLTIVRSRTDGITRGSIIDTTGRVVPRFMPEDHPGYSLHNLKPFGSRFFYNDSGGKSLAFFSSQTAQFIPNLPYTSFSLLRYSDRKDLAKVYIGSSVGLLDTTLTELLPVHFQDIRSFHKNRIAVKHKGKWGFADEKFRFRIPFIYDQVGSFRYGYVKVEDNKRNGVIDTAGRVVVPLLYQKTTVDSAGNRIYAEKEHGVDIYDMRGRLLLDSDYEYIAGYWGKGYSTFRKDEKMGVIDYDFHILCEPQYDRIGPFHENRAWVVQNNKGGFLDRTFQVVIPIVYDYIEDYALGFTQVKKDGKTYYIDIAGQRIHPSSDEIEARKNTIEKRREGFIDFSS